MSLLDLLKDPTAYRVGTTGQNAASKGIDYPEDKYGLSQGPLLGKRVNFEIGKDDPTIYKFFKVEGNNQGEEISYIRTEGNIIDAYIRGGVSVALERREIDFERIKKFLKTPAGEQFKITQTLLQTQNPRPQKLYNYGVNTLASVAAAGVSNVRRGGLLPSVGDFDVGALIGMGAGTYLTEPEFTFEKKEDRLRENNYGLGSPGALGHVKGLKKLINNINPLSKNKPLSYEQQTGNEDKVNSLPILQINQKTEYQLFNADTKDFVPFRFDVLNHHLHPLDIGSKKTIIFRAFLNSISDDYSAAHNTYKYNGRGEEFYTYNKFNRKIQVSFKIAAQTRHEMKPIYQKLNFLVAQTAPNYSAEGRIRTPFHTITIGDWFQRIPGIITQVNLSWKQDYPWEIALDRKPRPLVNRGLDGGEPSFQNKITTFDETKPIEGKDKDMLILPHVLDVSLSFQPIHDFTPSNDISQPFIGINGNINTTNWIEPASLVHTGTKSILDTL